MKRNALMLVSLVLSLGCAALVSAQRRPTRASAPAPRVAHPNQTPAERCTAIYALWMTDARASLQALGVEPAADFETQYRRETRNFDATCAALTPEQLTCLETAPNAIAAVGTCAVNEGKQFNDRVNPPMVASAMVSWHSHNERAPSDATTRAAIAQLVGTWQLADRYSDQRFTMREDGTATYVSTRNEQTQTHQGTVDVLSPTHLQARMGFATFNWGFFVDGDRVLFSNQTATGAYPIAARGVTRVGNNGKFFLIEGLGATPTCKGFGPRLEPLEVTCAWEGSGDARKLVVTTAAARSIESGTNMPAFPTRLIERRGHLIPDGDAMFWTRLRQ